MEIILKGNVNRNVSLEDNKQINTGTLIEGDLTSLKRGDQAPPIFNYKLHIESSKDKTFSIVP